ncbi:hypothetical protein J6590_051351 [Homalodisca vitripennis]|nr:hypothetical protein J6590_051351 [Homalodisca vitripennis]
MTVRKLSIASYFLIQVKKRMKGAGDRPAIAAGDRQATAAGVGSLAHRGRDE